MKMKERNFISKKKFILTIVIDGQNLTEGFWSSSLVNEEMCRTGFSLTSVFLIFDS